ncbi:MAG: hypothetical protein KDA72_21665, partial [Planctomycetales bacterium]|nr:hypothetical protein [Planctomycetales bacterium]
TPEIPPLFNNVQPQDDVPDRSPSDLLFEPPAEDAKSTMAPGKNVDFSIFDTGYPINDRQARVAQAPIQTPVQTSVQSLAVPPANRYRDR